jgi:hypothetical protein
MNAKLYTVDEANRTLPLVKAIVTDIVAKSKRLESARREQRKALARRPRLAVDGGEVNERELLLKREIRELEAQVDEHKSEIEELGCYLKDPVEKGLVDFPAYLGTDVVCLCWHMGEGRIAHYHGMREGFHDRKPLPASAACDSEDAVAPRGEPRRSQS